MSEVQPSQRQEGDEQPAPEMCCDGEKTAAERLPRPPQRAELNLQDANRPPVGGRGGRSLWALGGFARSAL
jgi:hypothetical protein